MSKKHDGDDGVFGAILLGMLVGLIIGIFLGAARGHHNGQIKGRCEVTCEQRGELGLVEREKCLCAKPAGEINEQ